MPVGGGEDKHVLFCSRLDGCRFFMGVYLPGRGYRHWKCPTWIQTLQQAELLATVRSFQLAAFMGWERAHLGSDSFVARAQTTLLCILRRFFWFRSWARVVMTVFWVSTELNLAEPASRAFDFRHRHEVRRGADKRFRAWQSSQERFYASTGVPPFP